MGNGVASAGSMNNSIIERISTAAAGMPGMGRLNMNLRKFNTSSSLSGNNTLIISNNNNNIST